MDGKTICQSGFEDWPNKENIYKNWLVADALLLDPKIQVTNTPMLKGILQRWQKVTSSLEFQFKEGAIPKGAIVNQLM